MRNACIFFRRTDPDWDGTVTDQNDIHFLLKLIFFLNGPINIGHLRLLLQIHRYSNSRKMEKTRLMREDLERKVFITTRSGIFSSEILWLKYFSLFAPWIGM